MNAQPTLPADLEAGLRRLRLGTIRHNAPEILLTAKTQRWTPEETLRVLIEMEVVARDESNMRSRMKTAARFPVEKTLDSFHLDESSIPEATHDYLVTLDWIPRADNLCLIGPAGTGKTHYLRALGRAAVEAGYRVRYYSAIELVETLWRAQADITVGKTIEQVCRNDLIIIDEIGFAPLERILSQLVRSVVSVRGSGPARQRTPPLAFCSVDELTGAIGAFGSNPSFTLVAQRPVVGRHQQGGFCRTAGG